MHVTLNVWRQTSNKDQGYFETYDVADINEDMSFLELFDVLNERLLSKIKILLLSILTAEKESAECAR